MAPEVGLEPTTNRLTADRSTTELRWIERRAYWAHAGSYFARASSPGKRFLSVCVLFRNARVWPKLVQGMSVEQGDSGCVVLPVYDSGIIPSW